MKDQSGGSSSGPGWVEAAAHMAAAILQSPSVKNRIDAAIRFLDPDYSAQLVRAILHTDPQLLRAIFTALPDLINIIIEVHVALAREITERPLDQIADLLHDIGSKIRMRKLGQATGALAARGLGLLAQAASRTPPSSLGKLMDGFAQGLAGGDSKAAASVRVLVSKISNGIVSRLERHLQQDSELARQLDLLAKDLANQLQTHPQVIQKLVVPLLQPLTKIA